MRPIKILFFLYYLTFMTINAQLVHVLGNQDLSQNIMFQLFDLCNSEEEDGLEVIKKVKKNWLYVSLINKQVCQNMYKLINEKIVDSSTENPRSRYFFNYCMEKIAPKMKYMIPDDTQNFPQELKPFLMRKHDNKILCASHLAIPLALKYIKEATLDLSVAELDWILNPSYKSEHTLKILEKFSKPSRQVLKTIYKDKLTKEAEDPLVRRNILILLAGFDLFPD